MVLGVILIVSSLSSCGKYEYEGKEIESIEYITVKYNGGYTVETKIDLSNGEVLKKGYFPTDEVIEYEVENSFDTALIDVFLDEVGGAGLFDLEDNYPAEGTIMDGSGWTLHINYTDGTVKTDGAGSGSLYIRASLTLD